MRSGVDPSMTLHALLGPRDNRFLSRFLKQYIIHLALLWGRERCTRSSSLSLWVARPGASCSCAHHELTGARIGSLPTPSSTAPLLKAAADAGQGRTQGAKSRLGAATGRWLEAAASRRGRTYWIASVCSCAAGNCWAMLLVASPKRPVWDTGTLRKRTLSASLCQADTARGGTPGPQGWTSHDPETVP